MTFLLRIGGVAGAAGGCGSLCVGPDSSTCGRLACGRLECESSDGSWPTKVKECESNQRLPSARAAARP